MLNTIYLILNLGSEKCIQDKDIFVVGETTQKIVKVKILINIKENNFTIYINV